MRAKSPPQYMTGVIAPSREPCDDCRRMVNGMLPREHGAYGQLLFPLVTAVAMGRPTVPAAALIATATAVFLTHEPLLVLSGARGPRAQREDRDRAWRWLWGMLGFAVVAGVLAWWTMPIASRWTFAVPIAGGLVAASWSLRGRERTTAGELAAGIALSLAAFPVGVAAGLSLPVAAGCVAAFVTGTVTATVSVRALIGRFRGVATGPAAPGLAALAGLAIILVSLNALLASEGLIHRGGFWGALPVTLVAVALAFIAPAPKFLRRVGWSLVAATAVASLVLVVSGHIG